MHITHQADYAIRAVAYLANIEPNQNVATSQIAEESKIPASFLTKIISQLSVAGLIRTSRGARGGVTLARPPENVSILDVVEAIDGPVSLNSCVKDVESCPVNKTCTIQKFWCDTTAALVSRLETTTFDQLVPVKAFA